jgi:hypothetical protein
VRQLPSATPSPAGVSTARRALLLVASVALGVAIGAIGVAITRDAAWFLAIPCCVAVAWFTVADPTRCVPARDDAKRPKTDAR